MSEEEFDTSHPWWTIIRLAQSMGTKVSVRLNIDGQEYVFAQSDQGQLDLGLVRKQGEPQ